MCIAVLVADKNDTVRDGMCFLVNTQPDMSVVGSAVNGKEAVRKAAELKPDVVVMDITMPELDGIEATQQIYERSPNTRVIILAIHASSEYAFLALQAGVRGYLLKETAGAEIVDAVRVVHDGRRYLSRKVSDKVVEDYVNLRGGTGVESH
ncbi:MAG: response regulator [Anaerolineales bacterium]|nr:response regulator [Anaerolineales bacterium]